MRLGYEDAMNVKDSLVDFVTGADVPRLFAPNWIRRDLSSLHGQHPIGEDGQAG